MGRMISFDTNVALRLVIKDDPEQCERGGYVRKVARGSGSGPTTKSHSSSGQSVRGRATSWTQRAPQCRQRS